MPKETDTFENDIKHHAAFHKTGNKKRFVKTTLQLTFGINLKSDNQHKTKQLKLW